VTPRFLADADIKRAIVLGVNQREPAVDFEDAQTASLEGLHDSEVLAIAASQNRILISHDYGTMPRHFSEFVLRQNSPGVFLISQDLPIGIAVEAILLIWSASDAADWENRLTYLPL
jgi:Domain of unknown function (DUF5615)